MSARAVGKTRTNPRKALGLRVRAEIERATADTHRAVVHIRRRHFQKLRELDAETKRQEAAAWERHDARRAAILDRVGGERDLVEEPRSRHVYDDTRAVDELPPLAVQLPVFATAADFLKAAGDGAPIARPRRRWWNPLSWWSRGRA